MRAMAVSYDKDLTGGLVKSIKDKRQVSRGGQRKALRKRQGVEIADGADWWDRICLSGTCYSTPTGEDARLSIYLLIFRPLGP
jgi:hypothetical protein